MTTHKHIEQIIENTFEVLKEVHSKQKEGYNQYPSGNKSRIIFPQYSNGETRLSEQELRFIFVEQFNEYCRENELHWYYSVETPTKNRYLFKEPKKPRRDEGGRSGEFDLTIHDEYFKRIALIEFKALNPNESCFTKDFLKLREEGKEILTYFIMYIKSYRSDTIAQLYNKIFNATDVDKINYKDPNTNLYCYVLEPPKGETNHVKIAQLYDKIFNATDDDKINYKDTNTNLHCFALKPPKGETNNVKFNHNSNNSKK